MSRTMTPIILNKIQKEALETLTNSKQKRLALFAKIILEKAKNNGTYREIAETCNTSKSNVADCISKYIKWNGDLVRISAELQHTTGAPRKLGSRELIWIEQEAQKRTWTTWTELYHHITAHAEKNGFPNLPSITIDTFKNHVKKSCSCYIQNTPKRSAPTIKSSGCAFHLDTIFDFLYANAPSSCGPLFQQANAATVSRFNEPAFILTQEALLQNPAPMSYYIKSLHSDSPGIRLATTVLSVSHPKKEALKYRFLLLSTHLPVFCPGLFPYTIFSKETPANSDGGRSINRLFQGKSSERDRSFILNMLRSTDAFHELIAIHQKIIDVWCLEPNTVKVCVQDFFQRVTPLKEGGLNSAQLHQLQENLLFLIEKNNLAAALTWLLLAGALQTDLHKYETYLSLCEENDAQWLKTNLFKGNEYYPQQKDFSHVHDYISPDYILHKISEFCDENRKIIILSGFPGMGKSCFLWNFKKAKEEHNKTILAYFFCQSDNRSHTVSYIVKSILWQMADKNIQLKRAIVSHLQAAMQKEPTALDDITVLFKNGICNSIRDADLSACHFIVMDALDELLDAKTMLDLITQNADAIPNQLKFIISSRPSNDLDGFDKNVEPIHLDPSAMENKMVISSYFRKRLAQYPLADLDTVIPILTEKSEGNFLYASKVCDEIDNGYIDLNHPEEIPMGLREIYMKDFNRLFAKINDYEAYQKILAMLCMVKEPISLPLLQKILDTNKINTVTASAFTKKMYSILNENVEHSIRFYHKYVYDWLLDKHLSGKYCIDPSAQREALTFLFSEGKREYEEYTQLAQTSSPFEIQQKAIMPIDYHYIVYLNTYASDLHEDFSPDIDFQLLRANTLRHHSNIDYMERILGDIEQMPSGSIENTLLLRAKNIRIAAYLDMRRRNVIDLLHDADLYIQQHLSSDLLGRDMVDFYENAAWYYMEIKEWSKALFYIQRALELYQIGNLQLDLNATRSTHSWYIYAFILHRFCKSNHCLFLCLAILTRNKEILERNHMLGLDYSMNLKLLSSIYKSLTPPDLIQARQATAEALTIQLSPNICGAASMNTAKTYLELAGIEKELSDTASDSKIKELHFHEAVTFLSQAEKIYQDSIEPTATKFLAEISKIKINWHILT